MAAEPTPSIKIFYCYARKDQDLRDELDTHLSALHRSGLVKSWYDGGITPGTLWEEEIEAHLNTANIILLLISPDFIKSDYCYSKEMTRAIARHEAGEARVLPILLRPVDWTDAPFSKLQMLPTNSRPVTRWPDRDEAFENVARGIRQVVIEIIDQYKAEERMEALRRREEQERVEALRRQREQEKIEALQRKEEQERKEALRWRREQEKMEPLQRREERERLETAVKQREQMQNRRAKISPPPQQLAPTQQGRAPQSSRRLSQNPWLVIPALIVIIGLLAAVTSSLAAPAFLRSAQLFLIPPANLTATASVLKTEPVGNASPQAMPTPDPDLKDKQQELVDITKGTPIISGFQKDDAWSTTVTNTTACGYDNINYIVNIKLVEQYALCLANGPSYKNFALQLTMDIKGDLGGIIFRSTNNRNIYYRLGVNQIYKITTAVPVFTFSLTLCDKDKCSKNSTNVGTLVGTPLSSKMDKRLVTLTVIVRDKNIDVYANGKFMTRFIGTIDPAVGQVGVYAADFDNPTTVTFSDLKIWSLDK